MVYKCSLLGTISKAAKLSTKTPQELVNNSGHCRQVDHIKGAVWTRLSGLCRQVDHIKGAVWTRLSGLCRQVDHIKGAVQTRLSGLCRQVVFKMGQTVLFLSVKICKFCVHGRHHRRRQHCTELNCGTIIHCNCYSWNTFQKFPKADNLVLSTKTSQVTSYCAQCVLYSEVPPTLFPSQPRSVLGHCST